MLLLPRADAVSALLFLASTSLVAGRSLPESNLLVGYASKCGDGKVQQAVRDGVNVVVWSFANLVAEDPSDFATLRGKNSMYHRADRQVVPAFKTALDVDCIRGVISELDQEGFTDVVHMVSLGGWNGGHLDTSFTALEIYKSWKEFGGDVFHGIDWDFEGNDNVASTDNFFSKECLDRMGQVSQLAKQDGYIVSAAPPQSYLDFSTFEFSRYVNHTNEFRQWHPEFSYLGKNVYAYLLAKYGDYIDFCSVQLYESYSRAGYSIFKLGASPETYLDNYIIDLGLRREQFRVKFEKDPELGMETQLVKMPLNKLVIGLANGWADGEKTVYISPEQVAASYNQSGFVPRGFMFFNIDAEGTNGVLFAKGMNNVLHIR